LAVRLVFRVAYIIQKNDPGVWGWKTSQ